jgi:hypothetical protein
MYLACVPSKPADFERWLRQFMAVEWVTVILTPIGWCLLYAAALLDSSLIDKVRREEAAYLLERNVLVTGNIDEQQYRILIKQNLTCKHQYKVAR